MKKKIGDNNHGIFSEESEKTTQCQTTKKPYYLLCFFYNIFICLMKPYDLRRKPIRLADSDWKLTSTTECPKNVKLRIKKKFVEWKQQRKKQNLFILKICCFSFGWGECLCVIITVCGFCRYQFTVRSLN